MNMSNAIITLDQLKIATRHDSAAAVEKCLRKNGVRFLYGKTGIYTTMQHLTTERDMTNQEKALGEAVAVLYFDDNVDYSSALWNIVELLGGEEATELLENDGAAAYKKYAQDR